MLVLGIILILLAAGAFVAVLSSGTNEQAALYGGNLELPTLVVFLIGAASMLIFIMGLELVRSGVRRANENRRTKRRLRKLEKREELRREDAQAGTGTTPPAPGPGGSSAPDTGATSGVDDQARSGNHRAGPVAETTGPPEPAPHTGTSTGTGANPPPGDR